MLDDAHLQGQPYRRPRRRRPYGQYLAYASAAAILLAALPRVSPHLESLTEAVAPTVRKQAATGPAMAARDRFEAILDRQPILGAATPLFADSTPLRPDFEPAYPLPEDVTLISDAEFEPEPAPVAEAEVAREPERVAQLVPLPARRPSDLLPATPSARLAERVAPQRQRIAARQDAEAERSFFDTVFGAGKPQNPALAYAPADGGSIGSEPRRNLAPAPFSASGGTAIYDISARTVTLPSGERLEAHSGLGATMDDPRYVHLRGRGSTPPGTYDLTEREAPFHGVRALRMHPVGGPGAIFNRNGLLTHSYLRGPSGASSGCISFRNYNRFLQAYLRGEVRRVIVVAGNGQDTLPSFGALFGRSRSARAQEIAISAQRRWASTLSMRRPSMSITSIRQP